MKVYIKTSCLRTFIQWVHVYAHLNLEFVHVYVHVVSITVMFGMVDLLQIRQCSFLFLSYYTSVPVAVYNVSCTLYTV